jgi:hypothetical protein
MGSGGVVIAEGIEGMIGFVAGGEGDDVCYSYSCDDSDSFVVGVSGSPR